MLPALRAYVKAITDGKVKNPGTKTFESVRKFVKDPLLESKMACFISIANMIEPFLTEYQTDRPMIHFLCADLETLLKRIMKRFMKVDSKASAGQLLALDIHSSENYLDLSKLEMGFVADRLLKEMLSKKKVSERDAVQIRMQARCFLKGIVCKMLDKCPIKYRLVRHAQCLSPTFLVNHPNRAATKFKQVLQCLVECKRIPLREVDQLSDQFSEWAISCGSSSAFREYHKVDAVDVLYHNNFPKEKYPMLWNVIRKILLLSHGQAAVERGFSLGKAIAKENQLPETISNMRLVKDYILSVGGIKHVKVTNEMIGYASSAYQKYQEDLQRKREEKDKQRSREKRKSVSESVEALKKKRRLACEAIDSLKKESSKVFDQAEQCGPSQLKLFMTANALRKSAEEKESLIVDLDHEIKENEDLLKSMM